MYLGDPRESLVSPEGSSIWEADNRVEERWQWGAQILDLCDLSPEEYKNSTAVTVKSIQDCGKCGNGGGGGDEREDNSGEAEISDEDEFSVKFKSPVASTIYVFVAVKDANGNVYDFKVTVDEGSDSANFDLTSLLGDKPYVVDEVVLNFSDDKSGAEKTIKDDEYEYSVTFSGDVEGKTYAISILCTQTDSLTDADYLNIINTKGEGNEYVASYDELSFGKEDSTDAIFYAPCRYVENYMTEEQEEEYFTEHSYDFILLTQENVEEIKQGFLVDSTNWTKSTILLNGVKFNKWMRRDFSGSQCPYSVGDNTCADYELTYTINIKK